MSAQCSRSVLALLAAVGFAFAASARADEVGQPMTQNVVYRIHDDPDDPNSAVTFTVWLSLQEKAVEGNFVGWGINRIRIRQIGEGSNPDAIWTEYHPNVATPDGLWWIEHASSQEPALAEFAKLPQLVGAATPGDPNGVNLKYDLEGDDYEPPPGGPPWDPTAALTYEFTLQGDPGPIAANTDEPVGVDPGEDDPPTGGG